MMRIFNVITDTVPAEEYKFAGNQKSAAAATKSIRVFQWRDLRGNVNRLPNYVKQAIHDAGYTAHSLGGTAFSHSVIGLSVRVGE
jgi:adenosylmethionine-8-amino-7-oxononanoate aminotransferase